MAKNLINKNATGISISNARISHGLTKNILSEKIGCSIITLDCWEKGKNLPNLINVIKLSNILKVKIDDLIILIK